MAAAASISAARAVFTRFQGVSDMTDHVVSTRARQTVTLALALLLALASLALWACERAEDFSRDNPLDPGNPQTQGDPLNVRAELSARHDTVTLRWDAVSVPGVAGYRVLRQDVLAPPGAAKAGAKAAAVEILADLDAAAVSYLDLTTSGGATYLYKVAVRDAAGGASDVANQEGATVAVVAYADLQIGKSVDRAAPRIGDTITYTVTVTNRGPRLATGVAVTDELPAGVTYQAHTDGMQYDPASGVWNVGDLARDESASLAVSAVVAAGTVGQTVVNEARVTGLDQVDPQASNDAASVEMVPRDADSGRIVIDPEPDWLDAPWHVERFGGGFEQSGSGDATLEDIVPGFYTVTWQTVRDWHRPSPATVTQQVAIGVTVTFTGEYRVYAGEVRIRFQPEEDINPSWTLAWEFNGPQSLSSSGPVDLPDMPVGPYTLTWGDVAGYVTPPEETQRLALGQIAQFTGSYIPR